MRTGENAGRRTNTRACEEITGVWPTCFNRGVYTLIILLSKETCLRIGKLGARRFPKGYYAYTGSALGTGASSLSRRVSRHLRKEKPKLWHIDYLLAHENAIVTAVMVAKTNKKLECKMNHFIKRESKTKVPVVGFGSTDCRENCESHLLYSPDNIEEPVVTVYRRVFKDDVYKILISPSYKSENPRNLCFAAAPKWGKKQYLSLRLE